MARLAQVRGAGQQHEVTVGGHDQALEINKSLGVVAGQVVHAFLPEQQEAIEVLRTQPLTCALLACVVLAAFEMQDHRLFPQVKALAPTPFYMCVN